jgi:hypothetical protein
MNYTKRMIENQKRRGHELLPQELRQKLPKLYSTDGQGDKAIAQVRLFTFGGWSWYITEFDGIDTCFGLVFGDVNEELGYFTITELEDTRIPAPDRFDDTLQDLAQGFVSLAGYPTVERDLYWQPKSLGEIRTDHQSQNSQHI